ncbi:phage tail tape measure protein [Clostridium sp. YIM B02505]|uniref:Phage tail tape measure protein n=1 Tax=Clostridium yunnanense TaxID=2800325 RepID=A0ABS1EIE9_9CLOT|nr:phage tail tape measure protein [Clostridium yunnanense]MBK1809136.1 phage tail tape measure protein [Clostridium yunnanense]
MGANIKINSESKQFQTEMQKVAQELKVMSSELNVATTQAELFGTKQEQLGAKSKELTNTIKGQNTIFNLQKQTLSALTSDIDKYKTRNAELAKSIEDVETKLKESIKATGEDSKETKTLQQELNKLQNEYKNNDKAIDRANSSIDKYKIKMNETEKSILQNKKALEDVNEQLQNSSNKFDKFKDNLEKTNEKFKGLNDGAKKVTGALAVGLVGATALGIDNAKDLTKALNDLQAKTGLTSDEMEDYKQIMQDIYANNFGEGYEDISESMAKVNQVTGLTNDELKNTTQNAILIRDTFGFDVSESINAVNGLMQNFGITSEQAYTLIAQGAQSGADKNGDLLDSLNEYGVQFKKLGLDAQEFTNVLITGAKEGAFSIDKVGDAVKEFAIRAVDGSKTTQQGFQAIGLDANKMATEFGKGGDSAKQAFDKTLTALLAIKDPLVQSQAGVNLFGTQFEDLGVKGLTALQGLQADTNMTAKTLENLNQVKYNDLDSAITGIGRQFQAGLSDVITTSVLPRLNEFANNIQTNMPEIQKTIKSSIDLVLPLFDGLGKIIGFVIDNSNILIPVAAGLSASIGTLQIINTVTKLMDIWKASTFAQTLAQEGLNVALKSNPIGLVVTAIGLLVAAFVGAYNNVEWFRDMVNGAFASIKSAISSVWNLVSNFKFPSFKLPHFKISGSFSLAPPSMPKLGVEWYANGGIMTQPTLFGMNGSNAMVGGESGAEAVLPLKVLWNEMEKNFDRLEQRLNTNKQQVIYVQVNSILDGKKVAQSIAKNVDIENAWLR